MAALTTDAAIAQVLETDRAWCQAMNNADWETLASLESEDFTITHTLGRIDDRGQQIAGLRSMRKREVRSANEKVRVYGHCAVMTSELTMTYAPLSDGTRETNLLIFLKVWIQLGDTWRLVACQVAPRPTS